MTHKPDQPWLPVRELPVVETPVRDAGSFTAWLRAHETADGAEVPCGACNACCRSGFFIHIGADEADSLAAIPEALLFEAPGASNAGRPG